MEHWRRSDEEFLKLHVKTLVNSVKTLHVWKKNKWNTL